MGLKRIPFLLFLSLILPLFISAQDSIRIDTLVKRAPVLEEDPIADMLDSLASLRIFEDSEYPYAKQYQNWYTYSDTEIPTFSDSVYFTRIAKMNGQSPFEYVYNGEVRKFIDLYAVKKRKLTARILGLAQIYFPLFEEQLDKYNMPLELKYLAVIESALNPIATSPAGAKGLWQFMYGTGKVYGLKVSSYVDDRYDPYKATIAACEHLSDLYDIYGSWSLALAAYNSGAGNVNKAIRRAGGVKNFWYLQKYLPKETRAYVPAFIAASYVMTYSDAHKISPVDPGILYYEVDTVTVKNPLSFDQISEMLNVPMEELQFLNPSFKHKFIPATAEQTYKIRLRKKYVGNFINNETALYSFKTKNGSTQDSLMKMAFSNYRESELYTVKSGETVSSVAKKFHMSVAELKSLNGLKSNKLKPKKKILVYSKPKAGSFGGKELTSTYVPLPVQKDTTRKQAVVDTGKSTTNTVKANSRPPSGVASEKSHTVKSGETLGSIAKKYNCSVNDLMSWNNLNNSNLKIGQKLSLVQSESSVTTQSKSQATSTAAKPKTPAPSTSAKYAVYTVQSGDNLWDIADKFDVTVAQIKSMNGLKNTNLKLGQKLKIPK